jgi:hypothetical protein
MTKEQNKFGKIGIGVDPGWVNLGFASVVQVEPFKVRILRCDTFNPRDGMGGSLGLVKDIETYLTEELGNDGMDSVVIERFAPYNNVMSPEAENITMLVGSLNYMFKYCGVSISSIQLTRAIDWKIKLAKLLAKNTSFRNPSSDLDKKFSIAAAKAISINPEIIKDDHTADAVCLATINLF